MNHFGTPCILIKLITKFQNLGELVTVLSLLCTMMKLF
jgi:hypothetical protein